MPPAFDPYRRWLGIPSEEQPPNHYRLLNIGLFETDSDVIQEAADRQMTHVQRHKLGQYAALSQKLLNELTAAKLCLLKPDSKAAYDRRLRSKLAKAIPAPPAAPTPGLLAAPPVAKGGSSAAPRAVRPMPAQEPQADALDFTTSAAPQRTARRRQAKRSSNQPILIAGAVGAAVCLVTLVAFLATRGTTIEPVAHKTPESAKSIEENASSFEKESASKIPSSDRGETAGEATPETAPTSKESEAADSEAESAAEGDVRSNASATAEVVDLLPKIKINASATGIWKRTRQGVRLLSSDSDSQFVCIGVPYGPPPEYQVEMIVEPQPESHVVLGIVAGGSQCMAVFDGFDGATTGLHALKDEDAIRDSAAFHKGRVLVASQPNHVLVTVRRDSIQMAVEGETMVDWHGPFERLGVPSIYTVPDTRSLFLAGNGKTAFLVRSLKLTPISGQGEDRSVPVAAPVDLARVEPPAQQTSGPPPAGQPVPVQQQPAPVQRPAPPGPAIVVKVTSSGRVLNTFAAPIVGLSAAGKMLRVGVVVDGNGPGSLQLWDLETGRFLCDIGPYIRNFNAATCVAEGRYFLTAGRNAEATLWDLIGDENHRISRVFRGLSGDLGAVAMSADSSSMVVGGTNGLAVWHASDPNQPVFQWASPDGDPISAVAVSADSSRLFAGCGRVAGGKAGGKAAGKGTDHKLHVWDGQSRRALQLDGHTAGIAAIALSLDGSRAVTAGLDKTLRIWDLKTLRSKRTLNGHTGPVLAAATTADGKIVVSGSEDSTVRVWDADSGRELCQFDGHTGPVRAVALTYDGEFALSGGDDKTLRLWSLSRLTRAAPVAVKPPASRERKALPAEADRQQATKLIGEIFATEIKQANKPSEKIALAERLVAEAAESPNDSECYALLDQARRLATSGASPALGLQIIEQLGSRFQIDVPREAAELAERLSKDNLPPAARQEMAEALVPLANTAIESGDVETGRRLLTSAAQSARKSGDAALARQIATRTTEVNELRKQRDVYQQATDKLKADPNDADANLVVGKHLCFVAQDWAAGLKHLAKSRDSALRQVAELELTAPATPTDRLKLADLWWSLVEPAKGHDKLDYARRSEKWYIAALPGLKGLTQTKVSRRLEELAALQKAAASAVPSATPAVQPRPVKPSQKSGKS